MNQENQTSDSHPLEGVGPTEGVPGGPENGPPRFTFQLAQAAVAAHLLCLTAAALAGIAGEYRPIWGKTAHLPVQITVSIIEIAPYSIKAGLAILPYVLFATALMFFTPLRIVLPVFLRAAKQARKGKWIVWPVLTIGLPSLAMYLLILAPRASACVFLLFLFATARTVWRKIRRAQEWRALCAAHLSALLLFFLAVLPGPAFEKMFFARASSKKKGPSMRLAVPTPFPFDVIPLPDAGQVVVLDGKRSSIHLADAASGEIGKTLRLAEGVQPQRGALDERRRRIFTANYLNGSPARGIGVVDLDRFEIERTLETPGCGQIISLDFDPRGDELLALCEHPGFLYRFRAANLSLTARERAPCAVCLAYDLAMGRDWALVGDAVFPRIYLLNLEGSDKGGKWKRGRTGAMTMGVAADPGRRLAYLAKPLERSVAEVEIPTLRETRRFRTEGLVRDIDYDPRTRLLAAGNYVSGTAELFDAESGKRLGIWRAGPKLRGVALDVPNRTLYAAAEGGVWKVNFDREAAARAPAPRSEPRSRNQTPDAGTP